MEDAGRDVLVVAGEDPSGLLVQHEEAGGVRRPDLLVGVVHARAGVEIEMIAVDQDGGVGGVMGPDAGIAGQVGVPEDIGVGGAGGDGRLYMQESSPVAA